MVSDRLTPIPELSLKELIEEFDDLVLRRCRYSNCHLTARGRWVSIELGRRLEAMDPTAKLTWLATVSA